MNLREQISRMKSIMGLISEQNNEVKNQLEWLRSYVKSPMYLERLKKEFPNKDQAFLEKERDIRYKNLENVEYRTHFVKSIGQTPGYTLGKTIPKTNTPGQFFNYKKQDWVSDTNVKGPKGYDKPGHVYLEKGYDPKNWNPEFGYETIPVHEFGHLIDDAGQRIPMSTVKKISNYTKINPNLPKYYKIGDYEFDYPSTPTEFINRLQSVRYLLNKQKIYNPSKQKFTEADFNKMINDPLIKNNDHYQSIFNSLKGSDQQKKENFIDLMNSIAQIPNQSNLNKV